MSEDTMTLDAGRAPLVPVGDVPDEDDAAGEALLEELLVEEVSIDGMCGVY